MAVDYLWHSHPLELRSVLSDSNAQCFICLQSVSGYNYRCPKCNFFLHTSCLKLPLESLHPLHGHHYLTLLSEPPQDENQTEVLCEDCKNVCSGFVYDCPAACNFTLHLQCAIKPHSFRYEVHKHPLTFSASPPWGFLSFTCKICGENGEGFCLFCNKCQFVAHVECSQLPAIVNYSRHEHPFYLTPVQVIEDGSGEFYCDVCEERVNVKGSIYYCADCIYIGHLGCMATAPNPTTKLSYKDAKFGSIDISNVLNIGTSQTRFDFHSESSADHIDDEDELAKMRCSFSTVQITNTVVELQHFSHQHPLTLVDETVCDSRHRCYACWGQISDLGYGCKLSECWFFLHKWCAELPQEIWHPIHPEHPLALLSRAPTQFSPCNACAEPCDGFTYKCKGCYFSLHAMCASIPSTLRNEIHQHPLSLCQKVPYSTRCKACCEDCTGIVFQCEICDLVLDFKCALLPSRVRHKCHVDPLTLTSPVEDESDEYYCDACEERREPNRWVYHCADCEFSAHMDCVVSELIGGPPREGPLQFDHHQHLLGLIMKENFSST